MSRVADIEKNGITRNSTIFIYNFHYYFDSLIKFTDGNAPNLVLQQFYRSPLPSAVQKLSRSRLFKALQAANSHSFCASIPLRSVLRTVLKSKLHRACITDANVDYEGSISIPTDLMEAADLWDGEKVLVTSITSGARLETYVIPAPAGSGQIIINGAAAHLINTGHRVTIMAWAISETPVIPKRLLLDEAHRVLPQKVL